MGSSSEPYIRTKEILQKCENRMCGKLWKKSRVQQNKADNIKKHRDEFDFEKHVNSSSMSLLTHPDVGGDEEFFKTINRADQILMNDGARETYNNFGLDEAEKVMNDENWYLHFLYEKYKFFVF